MSHTFRFVALSANSFEPLFDRSDAELNAAGVRRCVVDAKPGFPCRVSLVDADVGETVLLLPFTHHDVESPYRASGPIFVRHRARTADPRAGEVPDILRHRLLSLRAYDGEGTLRGAEVVTGREIEAAIVPLFARADVACLHVHNAALGCYICRVDRA